MSITEANLKVLRSATPSCEKLLHFNNAGASLMPEPVYDALTEHLALERNIGGYEAEAYAHKSLKRFYEAIGTMLRVQPDEIAYVENATRAWDMAFYAYPFQKGDRIITHASEYVSNYLAFMHMAKHKGVEIDIAPSDESGQIDVDALPKFITPETKMLAITHVPTQGGLVNPAAELGKVAKEYGLIYLLDACQSVGQLDVDVSTIGCHILSGTGRKFLRGPRGTGFLYVSHELVDQLDPPFIDLHAATWTTESTYELSPGAKRFENWESYVAGRVGLAAAVDYALSIGLTAIEERVIKLGSMLRESLDAIDTVTTHDLGQQKCGIVTFSKNGIQPVDLARQLGEKGINISVALKTSAQLDLGRRKLPDIARASVHYFNSEDEIDRFCRAVKDA